jgi:hypothetical protein
LLRVRRAAASEEDRITMLDWNELRDPEDRRQRLVSTP